MSTNSGHKRTPCRYFDLRTGRPLSRCAKDGECRFLHPGDRLWPGRSSDILATPQYPRATSRGRGREVRYPPRRQSRSSSRGRGRSPHGDSSARPRDAGWPSKDTLGGVKEEPKETELIKPKAADRREDGIHQAQSMPIKPRQAISNIDEALPQTVQLSEQHWMAFQQIARLSRESDRLNEVYRKEEAKIQTYKAIGATLEKITGQAEDGVEPQLKQSIALQNDCKKNVEKNDKKAKKMWNDVVDVFVDEVNRAVDNHVRVALLSITNEAERLSSGWLGGGRKRSLDNDAPIAVTENFKTGRSIEDGGERSLGDGVLRVTKKKRTSDNAPEKVIDLAQVEMIREMKMKIEQQAQTLAELARENDELRGGIQKNTLTLPSRKDVRNWL